MKVELKENWKKREMGRRRNGWEMKKRKREGEDGRQREMGECRRRRCREMMEGCIEEMKGYDGEMKGVVEGVERLTGIKIGMGGPEGMMEG